MIGVVYKLYCKNQSITEFYIGSSVNFKSRKYNHKSCCNNSNSLIYNSKQYKFIRDNGGFEDWQFDILLEVEVESREELRLKYESKFQLYFKPSLNSQTEGRTKKQHYKDNREKIKEYQKEYRENNKEYQKEYREKNKEKIKQYREDKKEKYTCGCGSCITIDSKSRHEKTKKHQNYLLSLSS